MALYRFEAKVISRGGGRSTVRAAAYRSGHTVTAAAAYRSADRIANDNTGQVHDFSRKRGVQGAEIMLPASAPAWMADRQQLWNAVERAEKRIDAQLARDFIISIPHELNKQQRREVVREFVQVAFVSRGLPCDIAWHSPERNGGLNHHAHVMMPFRVANENGFAKTKIRSEGERGRPPYDVWKAELHGLRVLWADVANRHLERAGLEVRIDHRSLAERGIERLPEPKMGPLATHVIEKDGRMSKAGEDRQNAAELNHLTAEAKQEHARAVADEAKVADLDAARRRREQQQAKIIERVENEGVQEALDREQAGVKQLAADEKKRQQRETAAAREAEDQLDTEKEKLRHEYRDKFHLDSRSAQDAEKIRQEKARTNDGDLNNAAERYQIALGENYNFRDPYGSMSRAAGAEHASFVRQREELKQAITTEKDPQQKQILELRRKIELSDHMAQVKDRLSGISASIAGRRDAPQAVTDRNDAATWREFATKFREERNQVIELFRAREAAKEQPHPQKAAGRDEPIPPKNPPGGGGSPMPSDLRQEPTQAQGRQQAPQPTPEQRQPPQRVPETAQTQPGQQAQPPGQGPQPTAQQPPQRGQETAQAPTQQETQRRGVEAAQAQSGPPRQGALDLAQQPLATQPQGQPAARDQQGTQDRAQPSERVAGRARPVLGDDERQAIEAKHRARNDALDQQAAQRSQAQRSAAAERPAESTRTDNREQSDTRREQAGRAANREQTDASRQTVADRHQQRNEALDRAAAQARSREQEGRSR